MEKPFDYFVIFAGMRTGSNFLESNLNAFPGVDCVGEAFNQHFIGQANKKKIFGMSIRDRDADPLALIQLMQKNTDGLVGFRFFFDHDPRVLDQCLADPRCAKVILTRNPVESYVSWEIARKTNQWRLGDMKQAKSAKITFDPLSFSEHLDQYNRFQARLKHALQSSGQTAFHLTYDDISDVEILNGLAKFLGVTGTRKTLTKGVKKQNPQGLVDKVVNFDQMKNSLAADDYFMLDKIPSFEPARGPMIPGYLAAATSPLLFMPVAGGPTEQITHWLADLDRRTTADLFRGFNQKSLRQWKRQAKGHQSFTVIRHPVARLHHVFVRRIIFPSTEAALQTKETLRKTYDLPVPEAGIDWAADPVQHRAGFIAFAKFVGGNLAGQTGLNVDPAWASQAEVIKGMSRFMMPGHILSEQDLSTDLAFIAQKIGKTSPAILAVDDPSPLGLSDIYNTEIEAAVRSAYQRDYMMFGLRPWAS